MLNFKGIPVAALIHALYHHTRPLGMGFIHNKDNKDNLTVDEVLKAFSTPPPDGIIRIDYFCGRPLKVDLNTETCEFNPRWYDRDAHPGAAEEVIAKLRLTYPQP